MLLHDTCDFLLVLILHIQGRLLLLFLRPLQQLDLILQQLPVADHQGVILIFDLHDFLLRADVELADLGMQLCVLIL
jgi:hypothetical protein